MKIGLLLSFLCFTVAMASRDVLSSGQKITSWEKPAFCRDLDCPPFSTLKTLGSDGGVELRKYSPGQWVSTDISGVSYKEAMRKGFMTLFGYISGANADGRKIEMTAPVKTKLKPGPGPLCQEFTVSFFLPYEYQDGGAPEPSEKGVYLESTPSFEVYVRSYGGFSSEESIIEEAGRVISELDKAGEKYETSTWFAAGYDAPFRLTDRHNEIWIPKVASF
ncbi:regulatory factor, effector binding domain-containing protein [Dunaliella salina]|uniref:Regulatory factor, effector binding domain-containing protein n=1 Tax=Dunaliella salina TaxID=3046 RepID=A0ABQ7H1H3_DUNSA|nr:regulatory factor, effector binding domain-containing protein [Dunaliella salina]|eukprot:KAF5840706.1 regulatory factor, effector binding domain-containing protein [Dunaliella salina]